MAKAELEAHHDAHHNLMDRVRLALKHGLYRQAVTLAFSALDHVDGMMQYERRYEDKEFDSVESIDVILKYSPVLFDFPSLDTLETLLKTQRRIVKNTSEDLTEKLTQARSRMWDAHRMWDHIEEHAEVRQDELRQSLGGGQEQWRSVAEAWEKMGLLRRTPEGGSYRLSLSTRLGEVVSGKCSCCGEIAEAPKAMFLEKLTCPKCRKTALFVILTRRGAASVEE